MTEIKLNEWRWGVMPRELGDDAALAFSLCGKSQSPDYTWHTTKRCDMACAGPIWYAILSLGPPTMPEPELRLSEGWTLEDDEEVTAKEWVMCVKRHVRGDVRDSYTVYRPTRRECVEEINRILGGEK